jgi:mannan endo-1,4-beta-mannosidase
MMKSFDIFRRPGGTVVLLAVIFMCVALFSANALAGFRVNAGKLLDGNGNPFMMRGVNHPHVWYASRTPQAIKDMASIGANSVRVVLGNGRQWGPNSASDVADVIRQLKSNRMIAVLEVHDVTGYGEKQEAAPLSTAVDYWISIKAALVGQEDYVIVNIGNEPLGNNVPAATWSQIHIEAITRLRQAGFTHTLMVDAANWGQDWEQIMLKDAPKVFAADPLGNTVFSVHMYQVYGQRSTIDTYMTTFVNTHRLPLVVGEFGADHQGQDVDEASILELAQKYQLGYLGWSWSGNSGGTESLDITYNFDVNNLSPWGNILINSTYGIKKTSRIASIFTGSPPEPTPTPTVAPTPTPTPAPGGCGSSPTPGGCDR